MHIKCKIVVAVLIVAATLIIGCAGGTELSVTAPEEVDVQSAIIRSDGTLISKFSTAKSGTLELTLNLNTRVTPEHNPNLLSGEISISTNTAFSMDVNAGEEYDISPQLNIPGGEITSGTLTFTFK
jgi:hypothetical protein